MDDETLSEIADGLALFQEHRPQTGADWVAVAERFIADDGDTSQSSPLFAALVLAVKQRDANNRKASWLLTLHRPFACVTVVVHTDDPTVVAEVELAAKANGLKLERIKP